MDHHALLGPVLAQVALTFVVGIVLMTRRVPALMKQQPSEAALQSKEAIKALPAPATFAAENFANLFEVPVLFYAVTLGAIAGDVGSGTLAVGLAWAFVALRSVHSWIHCGSNNVLRRFQAFALSFFILIALWATIVIEVYIA